MDRFAIIGGDIHKLIRKDQLNFEYAWYIPEDGNHEWIPIADEKRQPHVGTWRFMRILIPVGKGNHPLLTY